MADEQPVQVEKTSTVKGVTTFAPGSPTPSWALWIFRTEFVLNKIILFYLSQTSRAIDIKELVLIITCVDMGTWLFAHSMGVKKKDIGLPGDE